MKYIGKVVIVTGAARGIGREMALTFAFNGVNLVIDGGMTRKMISEP
jgi:NAD(P)-dependent dehydrogenase (short-subunit alcohol dehydrogenase family)